MDKTRKFEVLRNNKWIGCHISELKINDKFKFLDEPDEYKMNGKLWIAIDNPFKDENGMYCIKSDEIMI